MKEGYYVIRTYEAGQIGEKVKFWVSGKRPQRLTKRLKSELQKQQQNDNNAVRHLARLINANFCGGDVFAAVTFSNEGYKELVRSMPSDLSPEEKRDYIWDAAKHQLDNYLRRCRGGCKRDGIELKYIPIVSDMDGETGEPERVHFHIIAPAKALGVLKEKWKLGSVREKKVWTEPDHYGLAKYLLDQVRRIPNAKKFSPSRNLIIPMPKDRISPSPKEKDLQAPRNASVLYRSEYKRGRPQYVRYVLPRKDESGGVT